MPAGVRYVITLDADTRLPRDAALRLVGKMAHPLNRPRFDASRAARGRRLRHPAAARHAVAARRPRGSLFQRVFSGAGGIDPYAAAVSDVYQDLFGEGSYTGKGIYDVDAFEAALAGRVPENALLSHDLFEGIFARAGLASDVEVVEEYPSRYDVAAARQHRWTRGDWQLLPWVVRHRAGCGHAGDRPLARCSTTCGARCWPPLALATLAACWLLPEASALAGTLAVLAARGRSRVPARCRRPCCRAAAARTCGCTSSP